MKGVVMPETPEEQIRERIIELPESEIISSTHPGGISVQDFTPYLLIKMLERLEAIEASLKSIDDR
jgi:hypothetical protein